jgi:hypothetical protein
MDNNLESETGSRLNSNKKMNNPETTLRNSFENTSQDLNFFRKIDKYLRPQKDNQMIVDDTKISETFNFDGIEITKSFENSKNDTFNTYLNNEDTDAFLSNVYDDLYSDSKKEHRL